MNKQRKEICLYFSDFEETITAIIIANVKTSNTIPTTKPHVGKVINPKYLNNKLVIVIPPGKNKIIRKAIGERRIHHGEITRLKKNL